jgi:hypothetical protein
VLPRELQRSLRQEPAGLTPKAAALFVGALLLVLASIAILVLGLRRSGTAEVGASPPVATSVAVIAALPTAEPDTPTPPPPTPRPPTATPTRAATATPRPPTAEPPTATVPVATAPAVATPQQPIVVHGACAVALPDGFAEETPQGGYYPARDRSGFAALDAFDTANGQRTPEELAQGFATTVLSQVIQNYRQTGAERAGDGYRIDYTATAGGRPGRGSFYLKEFGGAACGATIFTTNDSRLPFATSFNLMVVSLQLAPSPRPGTATPTR